jgi:hypothetical protein
MAPHGQAGIAIQGDPSILVLSSSPIKKTSLIIAENYYRKFGF